jgi:hypothetical protein
MKFLLEQVFIILSILYLILCTYYKLLFILINIIEDDEEFFCEDTGSSPEDNEFDSIVGALEEILMDESFTNLQQGFCNKHCGKLIFK